MNSFDIVLGLFLAYGLYKGLKNGLFVELASLVALIAGVFGAIHFSYIAGDYLSENMDWDKSFIKMAAFFFTFLVIVFGVHFAGKFLTKIADFAMLGLLNKIVGGLFGILKTAIILGALLVFFERVNSLVAVVNSQTIEKSVLYKPIQEIGAFVFSAVLYDDESS